MCPRSATMRPSWPPPPRQRRVSEQEEAGDQPVGTPQAVTATAHPAAPSGETGRALGERQATGKGGTHCPLLGRACRAARGCSGKLRRERTNVSAQPPVPSSKPADGRPASCAQSHVPRTCCWEALSKTHPWDQGASAGLRSGASDRGAGGGAGGVPAERPPAALASEGTWAWLLPAQELRTGLTAKRSQAHPGLPREITETDACKVSKLS